MPRRRRPAGLEVLREIKFASTGVRGKDRNGLRQAGEGSCGGNDSSTMSLPKRGVVKFMTRAACRKAATHAWHEPDN